MVILLHKGIPRLDMDTLHKGTLPNHKDTHLTLHHNMLNLFHRPRKMEPLVAYKAGQSLNPYLASLLINYEIN